MALTWSAETVKEPRFLPKYESEFCMLVSPDHVEGTGADSGRRRLKRWLMASLTVCKYDPGILSIDTSSRGLL